MFKLVAKLMLHKQLVFEAGSVKLLGQNVVIMPLSNLFDILKLLDKLHKEHEVYLTAKKLGKEWITNLLKAYKMDTIKDQTKWGENVFTLAGFGKMQVASWDVETKEMIYRVYDSTLAKMYGKIGKAVDNIPRGWFAGASSVFFKTDIDCAEVKCLSKGDDFCEFLTAPKETLRKLKLIK